MAETEWNALSMDLYWRFTGEAAEHAPGEPGVFAFFDESGRVILMGSALKSLKSVLTDHWKGREGGATCGASFVGLEVCKEPLKREAELAREHVRIYGEIPKRRTG